MFPLDGVIHPSPTTGALVLFAGVIHHPSIGKEGALVLSFAGVIHPSIEIGRFLEISLAGVMRSLAVMRSLSFGGLVDGRLVRAFEQEWKEFVYISTLTIFDL